jgi:hypothetical protein
MRKIFIFLAMMSITFSSFAQSDTEVKLETIAKLKIYLEWLKKGYDIVQKGLSLINDIKLGDFDLHSTYFNSLETVKTPVKKDDKIRAMIDMQVQMLNGYNQYVQAFKKSNLLTVDELAYITRVFSSLLLDVSDEIALLTSVLTDGALQMNDNERITKIDKLYERMTANYQFQFAFGSQVQLQIQQRRKELEELENLQKLQ